MGHERGYQGAHALRSASAVLDSKEVDYGKEYASEELHDTDPQGEKPVFLLCLFITRSQITRV